MRPCAETLCAIGEKCRINVAFPLRSARMGQRRITLASNVQTTSVTIHRAVANPGVGGTPCADAFNVSSARR
jgi:hypothetical protein